MIKKLLHYRGIQILLVLTLYLAIAPYLPEYIHRLLFSISRTIQEGLTIAIPLIICFFVAHTIQSFKKSAPAFLLFLIIFEAASNFCSVLYAYACGHAVHQMIPPLSIPSDVQQIQLLWNCSLPKPSWYSTQTTIIAGILLGLINGFFKTPSLTRLIAQGKQYAEFLLTRIFSPLIPLFILGFVARMYYTKILESIYTQSATITLMVTLFVVVYIAILFLLGSKGSIYNAWNDARNIFPAGVIAFTSGSGLATMPWTIAGAAKNCKNKEFAQVIIPATTNIQQIGDCIINAFICCILYAHFFHSVPAFPLWLSFASVFVCARFTTAAVAGGAIFIMLPIYEKYLFFNEEMLAIILAFNVILDPLVTASNVYANGALCKIYELLWDKVTTFFHFQKTLTS